MIWNEPCTTVIPRHEYRQPRPDLIAAVGIGRPGQLDLDTTLSIGVLNVRDLSWIHPIPPLALNRLLMFCEPQHVHFILQDQAVRLRMWCDTQCCSQRYGAPG